MADVLALARRVESQSRAELPLVCANRHLARLAAGQEELAEHFARGVPPIGMWHAIATEPSTGPPRLSGALGWLECALQGEVAAGTHTLFVCVVERAVPGAEGQGLVRFGGRFTQA